MLQRWSPHLACCSRQCATIMKPLLWQCVLIELDKLCRTEPHQFQSLRYTTQLRLWNSSWMSGQTLVDVTDIHTGLFLAQILNYCDPTQVKELWCRNVGELTGRYVLSVLKYVERLNIGMSFFRIWKMGFWRGNRCSTAADGAWCRMRDSNWSNNQDLWEIKIPFIVIILTHGCCWNTQTRKLREDIKEASFKTPSTKPMLSTTTTTWLETIERTQQPNRTLADWIIYRGVVCISW